MASTEAMRLFVKILEEEDPGWYSRVSDFVAEPVLDVEMNHNPEVVAVSENGNNFLEAKTIPTENGSLSETQDKDVVSEGLGVVSVYDQWVGPPISGPRPKARYEHGAAVIDDKMYIFGGNHNGRYLNDLQVSRGGQSVTLVGMTLVIFGGQDAKRSLLNDLHILDLESMTWDEMDTVGVPPSPRSDHAAAVHADRYLLIFGGGSHATCFNDLHVLDLQTMEWSRPTQQGEIPSPRAGHAGVTIGENWFIVGGGDNKSGVSETVVLNMSTLVWSVVTTVQGVFLLLSEVNVLKPSHKSTLQSKMMETTVPDSVSAVQNVTNATRDESEFETGQEGKIREIVMDNIDAEPKVTKVEETNERLLVALKAEKEQLESSLTTEKMQTLKLKQELTDAETRNTDLYKELQSVRGQLAAEQSRCFKLEVDVAELRQKLQTMETLQKELEILQRQKAASEQAALSAKQRQSSGGVWGWLAGSPPGEKVGDA
ncbi:hypothetical protein DH2020_024271 [Rehmannia glutinosa]|uniref:ACB domain-containing protein n=1 Tax=Rehmannia glutinosa TaxID=99300 RepID=A0ABR0W904_REHGL